MLLIFSITFANQMMEHEIYMQRCLQLAQLGIGRVAPNPMVGAVLVYNDTIIGEGYHEYFGEPHAEVNCINSVKEVNKKLIPKATLYVSLEPCNHFGKTAPCVNLILQYNIKKVVIGCTDIFTEVNGAGIQRLKDNGVEVIENILNSESIKINKRFFCFHEKRRPFIILKWAMSSNGMIAKENAKPIKISNEICNRLVHQWRSEEDAILIGTNTAYIDNPNLTNRLWHGKNPIRLIIDADLKLQNNLNVFNKEVKTIVFNRVKNLKVENLEFIKIENSKLFIDGINDYCYKQNIQSILVEGGANTHQHFIDENCWDEARIIQNNELLIENGIQSAKFKNETFASSNKILSNTIYVYYNHFINE